MGLFVQCGSKKERLADASAGPVPLGVLHSHYVDYLAHLDRCHMSACWPFLATRHT